MHTSPTFGPIGSDKLPAPQGTLMATLIQGILGQKLQWGFVFVGAGLAVAIQVMGISALAWAVGAYLPLSTTMPIFVGGVVRFIVERMTGREEQESEVSSGMLYSTGLVAGGSFRGADAPAAHGRLPDPLVGEERGQVLRVRPQVCQIHVVLRIYCAKL